MPTIKIKEKCKACGGTGLYIGMAERDGAAIVCQKCKGTGCYEFIHQYEEFEKRIDRNDVKRVYEVNPGIVIGNGPNCKLEDFGGMPFKDWNQGKKFIPGMEDRNHTCPAWWYQLSNIAKRPNWKECWSNLGRRFSECSHFNEKEKCWDRWDKEFLSK